LQYDYIAAGHVTVDVLPDGSRRPGGSALYAGLQAARLGCRTLILTRGATAEIEELLAPYAHEVDVRVAPAAHTTTLLTEGSGPERSQRVQAWAGPMSLGGCPAGAIFHLAPVARELGGGPPPSAPLVGLTPQGLVRRWAPEEGVIGLGPPRRGARMLARICQAMVLSSIELEACAPLLDVALAARALVVVTEGERGARLLRSGQPAAAVPVVPQRGGDDLGAGDVFAAALLVALGEGRAPQIAASFAAAAAAVRMEGEGPGAIGDRAAIEACVALLADG
jgi:sugar/nucleoside kinase (ribokinase family)